MTATQKLTVAARTVAGRTGGAVTAVRTGVGAHPRAARTALAVAVTAALTGAAPLLLRDEYTVPAALAVGGVTGVVFSGGLIVHRGLTRRLGTFTALAALAVLASIACTLIAFAVPHCPGVALGAGDVAGRCGRVEIGNWMLLGAVMPLTAAILLGGPVLGTRLFFRAGRGLYRFGVRNRGTAAAAAPLRRLLTRRRNRGTNVPAAGEHRQHDAVRRRARKAARAARRTTRRSR